MISPGDDLQPIVDAHVPGGSYLLLSGVHWMQSVEPKEGDSYNGETGTAMIGYRAARPVFFAKEALAGRCAGRFVALPGSSNLLWADTVIDRRAVLYI